MINMQQVEMLNKMPVIMLIDHFSKNVQNQYQ